MKLALLLILLVALLLPATAAQLNWSGLTWNIRNQTSSGPGPNLWAGANTYLDAQGQLHLTIKKRSGKWTCA